MSTFTPPEIAWGALSPVIIVLGAAVVGVLVEAFVPAAYRRRVQITLAIAAPAGVLVAVAALWKTVTADGGAGGITVLGGSLLVDGPTLVLQATLAVLTILSVLVIADRTHDGEDAFAPTAAVTPGSDDEELARRAGLQQTEVFPLVLFATGGMLVFPAAGDLLTLFVALEVLSLPLYLLSGLARRRRLLSQEASMKYFLLGAFASAFMLFGIALLYGYSGSLRYADIAAATHDPSAMDSLLLIGALMVLAGLLFKVGAVPFHSWVPDVYQGAPTPVTGYMAACTKVAALGALLRVTYTVLPDMRWDLGVVLWIVAIATMIAGTVAALMQTDMKRMLGYSSVAHAGFALTGIVALSAHGVTAVLFYLLVYGAATVGAFGIVTLVRERSVDRVSVAVGAGGDGAADDAGSSGAVLGEATHLSQWAGLGRTNPALAATFALFLLSFAGIPLTAGFAGKFAVFSAAAAGGATALAIIGVLCSSAAVFFYIRVIVLMFFTPPPGTADEDEADGPAALVAATSHAARTVVVAGEGFALVAIVVCAAITAFCGIFPGPVLDLIRHASTFIS